MSVVDFESGIWHDPWFQRLSRDQKLAFIFLWTNPIKNIACMYQISLLSIAQGIGCPEEDIKKIVESLAPKVVYDPEEQLVWVKSYVRRQFMRTAHTSPKIIAAISKALHTLAPAHRFIAEFLSLYDALQIVYRYPIDGVNRYPTGRGKGIKDREGKGEGKGGGTVWEPEIPTPAAPAGPTAGDPGPGGVERGEFKEVRLTDEEVEKLVDGQGGDRTRVEAGIELLDSILHAKRDPKTGKLPRTYQYGSHYAVLKKNSWVWERLDQRRGAVARPAFPKPGAAQKYAKIQDDPRALARELAGKEKP